MPNRINATRDRRRRRKRAAEQTRAGWKIAVARLRRADAAADAAIRLRVALLLVGVTE